MVELGDGSWGRGTVQWDTCTMTAGVEGLPRDNLPKVVFVECADL